MSRWGAGRRRVVNGVSGYDPPHYTLLQIGLNARDPATLRALASIGPLDAILNRDADPDGSLERYLVSLPGVERIAVDGSLASYRLPAIDAPAMPRIPIAIVEVTTSADQPHAALAADGRSDTQWQDGPQRLGQWIQADLGGVHVVGAVDQGIARDVLGFPRRLAIETSEDGTVWRRVWDGPTVAEAFAGAIRAPRDIVLTFRFDPVPARFVRLTQLAEFEGGWTVSELRVHAPR
jgi:hypothetical protein